MPSPARRGPARGPCARQSISSAAPSRAGRLLYREGQPLTSEKVRSAIEVSLLEDGCEAMDTIVAGGLAAADPHARGTGPLAANAPIVIDIFPRSKSSRYFADMTRTVLKGEAAPEVKEIYEAVRLAQDEGLKAIRAGVSGKEVHSGSLRSSWIRDTRRGRAAALPIPPGTAWAWMCMKSPP